MFLKEELIIFQTTRVVNVYDKRDKASRKVLFSFEKEYLVIDFGFYKRISIPLVFNKSTGELCIKYSSRTNAFKLIKYLIQFKGIKKLKPERWFRALSSEEYRLYSVDWFKKIVSYLWYVKKGEIE